MQNYKPREIKFVETVKTIGWKVKLYTISKTAQFDAKATYANAISKLPEWLSLKNSFDASHEKIAFLIIHSGNEGVFSIINWWVGKNMLNTHIFFSEHNNPKKFKKISGDGLSPCIWELEIINHERVSWVSNVLKKPSNPDYLSYLNDNYNGII